jgi:archaellum component FlaC
MKPLETDSDRMVSVRTFANGCYDGIIKISSYDPMVTYLNGGHIKVLYKKLPQSREEKEYDQFGQFKGYSYWYNSSDAKLYLEWLIQVVRGSEKVDEAILNEAYDQLDKFILILRDDTDKKNVKLAKPYDWIEKLEEFEEEISNNLKEEIQEIHRILDTYCHTINGYDEKLEELANTLDKRSQDMIKPLEKILTWLKTHSPTVEAMQKEYAHLMKEEKSHD